MLFTWKWRLCVANPTHCSTDTVTTNCGNTSHSLPQQNTKPDCHPKDFHARKWVNIPHRRRRCLSPCARRCCPAVKSSELRVKKQHQGISPANSDWLCIHQPPQTTTRAVLTSTWTAPSLPPSSVGPWRPGWSSSPPRWGGWDPASPAWLRERRRRRQAQGHPGAHVGQTSFTHGG